MKNNWDIFKILLFSLFFVKFGFGIILSSENLSPQSEYIFWFSVIVFLSGYTLSRVTLGKRRYVFILATANKIHETQIISFLIPLLLFSGILALIPLIFEMKPPPLNYLILQQPIIAHEERIFFTKLSKFSSLIEVSQKLMLISALLIGVYRHRIRRSVIFCVIPFIFVLSILFYQKSVIIYCFGCYWIGLYIAGHKTFNPWQGLLVLTTFLTMVLSWAFVQHGISIQAFRRFVDLIYRRMGSVSVDVYDGYIRYGFENNPLLLQHNFSWLSSNEPLPVIIYHYIKHGDNPVGWANGFFVGDLFVNFGWSGVTLGCFFLGIFFGKLNKLSKKTNKTVVEYIHLLFAILIFNFLMNNSLFSSVVILMFIFMIFITIIDQLNRKNIPRLCIND